MEVKVRGKIITLDDSMAEAAQIRGISLTPDMVEAYILMQNAHIKEKDGVLMDYSDADPVEVFMKSSAELSKDVSLYLKGYIEATKPLSEC